MSTENKYIWYDVGKILTYNRNFNFINSKRGTGKTYTFQKWFIKEFLEKGKQLIYLVKFKNELEEVGIKQPFEKVLNNEYPNVECTQVGNELYLDGELFCYGIAITDAQKIKKLSYPNVYYMLLDEYMVEKTSRMTAIKDEVDEVLSIYSTVDRYEDRLKCFFLGNTTTHYNKYHQHEAFRIPKVKPGEIWTSENVLYHWYVPNHVFEEKIGKTKFARMLQGTRYGKYSVDGDFIEDNDLWVEERTERAKHLFVFVYLGKSYGVWVDYNQGRLYVSDKYDPSCRLKYSLTLDDHSENTMITKVSKSTYLKMLGDCFRIGNVRFESIKVKQNSIGGIQLLL